MFFKRNIIPKKITSTDTLRNADVYYSIALPYVTRTQGMNLKKFVIIKKIIYKNELYFYVIYELFYSKKEKYFFFVYIIHLYLSIMRKYFISSVLKAIHL